MRVPVAMEERIQWPGKGQRDGGAIDSRVQFERGIDIDIDISSSLSQAPF